ncbi:MAG TPA: adenosylcobinamide-GDP ribazoletransferase [Acidisphaera sp.]|nr:adenosylcobinamide-GDP ribazoletransferase [Acidisphaera sp.]
MRGLASALTWLTRIPAWRLAGEPVPIVRALWAFPVVGALVGAVGAAVFALCARVPALAAVLAIAAMLLTTGALHEDGLADTADGLGGGAARESALRIMRDSRIGTYGALALMLTLAVRATALGAIADPVLVATALVATGALSRACLLLLVLVLEPARPDGMAATLRERIPAGIAGGLMIAAVIVGASLRGHAVPACAAALVVTGLLGLAAHRRLGGYTGDVLGACVVLAESAALATLALSSG